MENDLIVYNKNNLSELINLYNKNKFPNSYNEWKEVLKNFYL